MEGREGVVEGREGVVEGSCLALPIFNMCLIVKLGRDTLAPPPHPVGGGGGGIKQNSSMLMSFSH